MTQRLRHQRRRQWGIDEGPDDDGHTSSSGYWEGVGGNVAPSRFGLMIVLVVIVVFRRCRLGCRRIRHHSPHPDRLSFSSSSSFVVSVVLVVVVFIITPPPPDCFILQFLDRIARLRGIVDYKDLMVRRTYHITLLFFSLSPLSTVFFRCSVLINRTVMFPYEAHLFTNNISCSI